METVTLINGNKQKYTMNLPKIHILDRYINDTALEHIFNETGLLFKDTGFGYVAQPLNSNQITRLFLTYNYKTQYHNNADSKNTLYLKGDHHVGFQVESICFDCCKENYISVNGLSQDDRLAC
ncbi:hypothetical protein LCGC14_2385710 [marine sediment metagenome]|uniref:Uncharacterized protein n=1 Tax=marine sediment metagenome TaxID=412755 RepID=A0A0F9BZS0_9ZZZZ